MLGAYDIFDWQMGHVTLAGAAVDVTVGQGAVIVLLRASTANSGPVMVRFNATPTGSGDIGAFRLDAGQTLEVGPIENCTAVYVAADTTGQTVSYLTGWR